MNIDNIIDELTKKTGIRIRNDDPIITTVLLNKAILSEYVEEIESSLNDSISNVSIKENITIEKLKNILSEQQKKQNKEIEISFNRFIDNLHSKLSDSAYSSPTPGKNIKKINIYGYLTTFLLGLLTGSLVVYLV